MLKILKKIFLKKRYFLDFHVLFIFWKVTKIKKVYFAKREIWNNRLWSQVPFTLSKEIAYLYIPMFSFCGIIVFDRLCQWLIPFFVSKKYIDITHWYKTTYGGGGEKPRTPTKKNFHLQAINNSVSLACVGETVE